LIALDWVAHHVLSLRWWSLNLFGDRQFWPRLSLASKSVASPQRHLDPRELAGREVDENAVAFGRQVDDRLTLEVDLARPGDFLVSTFWCQFIFRTERRTDTNNLLKEELTPIIFSMIGMSS
jgi:hypothetical protein